MEVLILAVLLLLTEMSHIIDLNMVLVLIILHRFVYLTWDKDCYPRFYKLVNIQYRQCIEIEILRHT